MSSDSKKIAGLSLTSLKDARRNAKASTPSPTGKSIPLKLTSLQEARAQMKSSLIRADSTTSLPDKLKSIDNVLRLRNVFSLSPKEATQFEDSKNYNSKNCFEDLSKNQDQVFPEKLELPEINEKLDLEEDLSKNQIIMDSVECNNHEEQIKTININAETSSKHVVNDKKNSKGKCETTKVRAIGKVKKPQIDVLEFMEKPKINKKLTKDQERGLLDRLQGFSIKSLK